MMVMSNDKVDVDNDDDDDDVVDMTMVSSSQDCLYGQWQ